MSNENGIINDSRGKVVCDRKILLSIISLATKEISGVSALVDSFKLKCKKIFNKDASQGVVVKFNKNGKMIIDVYIRVYNTCKVPDISFKVQDNIKNNISSMVEMAASRINVHIVGVDFVGNRAGEE